MAKASGAVVGQIGQRGRLTALDLLDDGEQQLVARTEVVEQHAMAGADGLCDLPQRPTTDATVGDRVDRARRAAPGAVARQADAAFARSSLLGARLEALALEVEVAPGQPAHEHADDHAERTALVDALPHERPFGALRHHLVRREGRRAEATAGATSTTDPDRPRSPPTRPSAGAAA